MDAARIIAPVLVLAVAGFAPACGAQRAPRAATAPSGTSPARSPEAAVSGDIVVKGGSPARGKLVLGWHTVAERKEIEAGRFNLAIARRMIDRWRVGEDIDFGKTPRVHYRLEGAPPDAAPAVILDVEQSFWPTVFGRGRGMTGTAKSGGGDVELAPNPPQPNRGEPCSGPRYKLLEIDGAGLAPSASVQASSVPGRRRFCAWLPPSWSQTPSRRYPIALLLPGFMSSEMAYVSGQRHFGTRLDAISAETGREAILVGVDTSTSLGSTYLEDSPAHGPFASFLSGPALAAIERELRAIPRRTARALIGQSTGGYNVLSFGLRRSDLFSVLGASSPDAPDMEAWLLEPGTRRPLEWIRKWTALEDVLGGPGQMTSYAADWSVGKKWPFDPATGVVDEPALAQWVAKTPHGLLRDRDVLARVKRDLSGRVMIIVGRKDEFDLFAPAERFAKELDALGVATKFVPTDHGHANGEDRMETALRFALERLDVAE